MPSVDTNILVRYLVRDDEKQFRKALFFFQEQHDNIIHINLIVLLETWWVLKSIYNYEKVKLIKIIQQLIYTQGLEFQSELAILNAIELYENTNFDFEDCLIDTLNMSAGHEPTYTFDKKASKLKGMQLLK